MMQYRGSKHVRRFGRPATALVEMAIAALLLMTLTLGAVEYGWLFLKQQQITNTARQAARLACTADATRAAVDNQISTMMASYNMGSTGYSTTVTPADPASAARGDMVSVQISVTYSKITITNFKVLPLPATMSATVSMEKEGI